MRASERRQQGVCIPREAHRQRPEGLRELSRQPGERREVLCGGCGWRGPWAGLSRLAGERGARGRWEVGARGRGVSAGPERGDLGPHGTGATGAGADPRALGSEVLLGAPGCAVWPGTWVGSVRTWRGWAGTAARWVGASGGARMGRWDGSVRILGSCSNVLDPPGWGTVVGVPEDPEIWVCAGCVRLSWRPLGLGPLWTLGRGGLGRN